MITPETILKAAKASGLTIVGKAVDAVVFPGHKAGGFVIRNDKEGDSLWNPLTDDTDNAMIRRGARISVYYDKYGAGVEYFIGTKHVSQNFPEISDKAQAEREAVILCAAQKFDTMNEGVK